MLLQELLNVLMSEQSVNIRTIEKYIFSGSVHDAIIYMNEYNSIVSDIIVCNDSSLDIFVC